MSSGKSTSKRFGGAAALLVLSVVFHAVYLGSIFDIYFVSPVTRVENRHSVGEALAKRVVLIVGDGLRADKLFQTYSSPPFSNSGPLPAPIPDSPHSQVSFDTTTPAPFIRDLIQSRQARWGISHTRVPTESRPGHVALIAGMYEDVSAVTKGWQTNPVSFDSVFNQSSHTFSFGSPDILPMFKEGASPPSRVDAFSYGHDFEDFSSDAVYLDLWVLDQLKALLTNATSSPELDAQLRADGTVIFLHLLGLDTTGHSYRPHGPEYHRNIRVLDYVVKETSRVLQDFYGEKKGEEGTAFVLTADHGMSSKGNHGDGELDNTRTPLVVWGAGVATEGEEDGGHDNYSEGWGLAGVRRDVEQADVAVLMSTLGGLPIPANSAGRLPIDYLNASPSFKARAALTNARQVLEQFTTRSDLKRHNAISFRPYPKLQDVDYRIARIETLIATGVHHEAQAESLELVRMGLEGLRYFQTYDWFILRSIVTAGFTGFMLYSVDFVLKRHVYPNIPTATSSSLVGPVVGISTFAILSARFAIERSPFTYYLYAIFPCFFWGSLLHKPAALQRVVTDATAGSTRLHFFKGALVIALLQSLVMGYRERWVLSVILIGMGWTWPLYMMSSAFKKAEGELLFGWKSSCSVLAIFPLLPVEKGENIPVILSGGFAFLALGWWALDEVTFTPSPSRSRARYAIKAALLLTLASMVVTQSSARGLQRKQGLPLFNQAAGWIILVSAFLIPFLHGRPRAQPFFERLLVVLASFGPAFIILSLSYEALFLAAFCTTLCLWMTVESKLASGKGEGKVDGTAVRIALFFLTFLHVAFFGVGNVASISSFYLEPVYRLIPVFAPFPMAALLLFKLLTPFMALAMVSTTLNRKLRLPPFALFTIASTLSDVLTINFFFLVSDQGSWLEIGSTITDFAICSLLSIFNTILFLVGEAAMAHAS